jgi:hypothetical protein
VGPARAAAPAGDRETVRFPCRLRDRDAPPRLNPHLPPPPPEAPPCTRRPRSP